MRVLGVDPKFWINAEQTEVRRSEIAPPQMKLLALNKIVKNDENNYKLLAIKPDRQPERVVMTTVRPAKIFRTKSSRTLNTSESYHQNRYTHCFQ